VGHVPETYTSFLVPDGLRGLRLGVIREPMNKEANPQAEDFKQVRGAIDRALNDLREHGAAIVDPVEIPGVRDIADRTGGAWETEAATNAYLAAHPYAPAKTLQEIVLSSDVLPARRARLIEAIGRTTNDPGYLQHLLVREQLRQSVYTAMADHQLDALIYATFDHDPLVTPDDVLTTSKNAPYPGNNRLLSPMIGFPAISVPAGFSGAGLPIGIEFLGRPFTEGLLLRIAYNYEQATHHRRPPDLTPALPGEP
jgi:Asp-tRNA(Asn)/Glu-tRNA(Gln) amidotransferase A subunit family amidase